MDVDIESLHLSCECVALVVVGTGCTAGVIRRTTNQPTKEGWLVTTNHQHKDTHTD